MRACWWSIHVIQGSALHVFYRSQQTKATAAANGEKEALLRETADLKRVSSKVINCDLMF